MASCTNVVRLLGILIDRVESLANASQSSRSINGHVDMSISHAVRYETHRSRWLYLLAPHDVVRLKRFRCVENFKTLRSAAMPYWPPAA